ncbi:hypothetical protein L7F22_058557 [Adiantum nelumboides]|nr:hypothetical protein [Adiantum nelumboides]
MPTKLSPALAYAVKAPRQLHAELLIDSRRCPPTSCRRLLIARARPVTVEASPRSEEVRALSTSDYRSSFTAFIFCSQSTLIFRSTKLILSSKTLRANQQTHEVGESSRPPQIEDEIFRTQLVTAVAMFTQVMQNPRFMAFLQPLPPSQSIGNKKSEPAKAQPQVIHTAVSMETPVHLPETMQSPNPVHNAHEQIAFFQQFYSTVTEIDYITLRYGFVKSHLAESSPFNFHKYIQRSFQEDFKHVVGISPGLWAYTIFWLLINVHGWETSIFVTLIPLLLVLAVGMKMQLIITRMATQITDKHAVVMGMPLVKPNDNLFWFSRPRLILHCLHFILFQNALEISFDIWAAISFPPHNCLYGHPSSLVRRLVIGIVVQMVCGVITLPIYALVSQMGSNVKRTVFEEHIQLALKRWHKRAKENAHKEDKNSTSPNAPGTSQSKPHEEDTAEIVIHGPRTP